MATEEGAIIESCFFSVNSNRTKSGFWCRFMGFFEGGTAIRQLLQIEPIKDQITLLYYDFDKNIDRRVYLGPWLHFAGRQLQVRCSTNPFGAFEIRLGEGDPFLVLPHFKSPLHEAIQVIHTFIIPEP